MFRTNQETAYVYVSNQETAYVYVSYHEVYQNLVTVCVRNERSSAVRNLGMRRIPE